jgi:ubiquinone/menaquinone biosynthesis C-methylase UbiE
MPDMDLAVAKVVEKYRRHAAGYDASARHTMALREKVVGLLGLVPGETVLDVACGTGLSLPLLRNAVGPSGRIIGVEVSPDMLALARARIYGRNWDNVTLIESAMEKADLGGAFDAALFNYTHDVMQSPRALERTFSFAKRGARVAIAGIKHPPHWLFPLRLWRLLKARPYVTNLSGLDRPWSRILSYVPDLQVEPVMLGTNYLARGTVR